jgi:hypothetical protein
MGELPSHCFPVRRPANRVTIHAILAQTEE